MNRKPRPSEAKYSTGRSIDGRPDRAPATRGASSGTASTSKAITTACSSTARLTSCPTSACGRISSRFRIVGSWFRRRMA